MKHCDDCHKPILFGDNYWIFYRSNHDVELCRSCALIEDSELEDEGNLVRK